MRRFWHVYAGFIRRLEMFEAGWIGEDLDKPLARATLKDGHDASGSVEQRRTAPGSAARRAAELQADANTVREQRSTQSLYHSDILWTDKLRR